MRRSASNSRSRADVILFYGDPLGRPRDLLGGKTVIKDGVVGGKETR